jgi:hypothetical protein
VRSAAVLFLVVFVGAGSSPESRRRFTPAPLVASTGIGTITGDCRSGTRATFTFHPDYLAAGETVTASVGARRVRAEVWGSRSVSITVRLISRRRRRPRFDILSPVVTWTVFQNHEPSETRVRVKLQVTIEGSDCLPTLTRVQLVSHSH